MCPNCKTPMLVMEVDAIEIDFCLSCRGTWLDRGELEMIAERAQGDVSAVREALAKARHQDASERRCPRCDRNMKTVTLASPPGLQLETCKKGHGLWFDRGELLTLVRAGAERTEGVAAYFSNVLRSELEENPSPAKGA